MPSSNNSSSRPNAPRVQSSGTMLSDGSPNLLFSTSQAKLQSQPAVQPFWVLVHIVSLAALRHLFFFFFFFFLEFAQNTRALCFGSNRPKEAIQTCPSSPRSVAASVPSRRLYPLLNAEKPTQVAFCSIHPDGTLLGKKGDGGSTSCLEQPR
ncbi:hypothetical protein VTI74DRAFT_4574 [Chaetomium olivicolor]